MQKIQFDSGVQEYRLSGGGVLRFNPCDPNLYSRFLDAAQKIQALEQELGEKARNAPQQDGYMAVELLVEADKKMKALLQQVFGEENDFDRVLGGVNLLAVAGNGERVITNLFAVLQPILIQGAEKCAQERKAEAVQQAKLRRGGR